MENKLALGEWTEIPRREREQRKLSREEKARKDFAKKIRQQL
jgi:hypothetical protein